MGTVATRTRHQQKKKASSWNKPIPILIHIFTYADPETLRMICLVSTQFYDIITNAPAMANHHVVPLLQISPSKNIARLGRTARLVEQLHLNRDKLQHYHEIKFINGQKFDWTRHHSHLVVERFALSFQLNGVIYLDMPSFIPDVLNIGSDDSFPRILRNILPNLREINLSNTSFDYEVFLDFPQKCMHLNKITWNNIRYDSNVSITGEDMRYENNLTQICMDDSIFRAGFYCKWMSNLEDVKYSTIYPFHALMSSVLERVSIRNARWFPRKYPSKKIETFNIQQNALIKFVRNAPKSLRWFCM